MKRTTVQRHFAFRLYWLIALVGLLPYTSLSAAPGRTFAGLSYPLDGINGETDLKARLLSGGCWLAGLPGFPAYNGTCVHAGIDLRASLGDTIYAIADGIVDPTSDVPHSGYGPGWTTGRVMIVRCTLPDGTPYLAVYGHTQNHKLIGGQAVKAGDPLAEVGPWLPTQGGPHLHLTIRIGELPRYGWGTPTLIGGTVRDGAECVGSAEEVVQLGYRNPLEFLQGESQATCSVVDAAHASQTEFRCKQEEFTAKEGWGNLERLGRIERRAGGQLQTVRGGTLMLADKADCMYLVAEPLWTIYDLKGGPETLGYPTSAQYQWGDAIAQSFEKALLVWERTGDIVRVIPR